jgi:hypothetical protein
MSSYIDITANGAGDMISVIGGKFDGTPTYGINAAGAGDTITVAGACGVAEISNNGNALGANDTINIGDKGQKTDAHVIVGADSTVNLVGHCTSAEVDATNVATGATTSGSYAFTTISGVHGGNLQLDIGSSSLFAANDWAGDGCVRDSQVNVSTAGSLAGALNLAANQAAVLDQQFNGEGNTTISHGVLEINGGTGLADWFQYGGNTYIVEAMNTGSTAAAHSALGVHDEVIKLTGLVDVNHVCVELTYAT